MAYDPEAQQARPKPAQAPARKIQDDAGPVSPPKVTVESAKRLATDDDTHALFKAIEAGAINSHDLAHVMQSFPKVLEKVLQDQKQTKE